MFGAEPDSGVKLDENFWEEEDKVTILENNMLEAPFTEEEIRTAVFDTYADGALALMVSLLCLSKFLGFD